MKSYMAQAPTSTFGTDLLQPSLSGAHGAVMDIGKVTPQSARHVTEQGF